MKASKIKALCFDKISLTLSHMADSNSNAKDVVTFIDGMHYMAAALIANNESERCNDAISHDGFVISIGDSVYIPYAFESLDSAGIVEYGYEERFVWEITSSGCLLTSTKKRKSPYDPLRDIKKADNDLWVYPYNDDEPVMASELNAREYASKLRDKLERELKKQEGET